MHHCPGAGWLLHPLLDVAQPGAFSKHTKPLYGVKVDYYMISVANREQVIQVIKKIQKHFSSVDIEYVLYLPPPCLKVITDCLR